MVVKFYFCLSRRKSETETQKKMSEPSISTNNFIDVKKKRRRSSAQAQKRKKQSLIPPEFLINKNNHLSKKITLSVCSLLSKSTSIKIN